MIGKNSNYHNRHGQIHQISKCLVGDPKTITFNSLKPHSAHTSLVTIKLRHRKKVKIEDLVGKDSLYHNLIEFERELDYKITRKQVKIADAAFKVSKISRNMKICVSHTCENQTSGNTEDPNVPASWTLRVEGRLETFGRQSKTGNRPFSQYIRKLFVEWEEDGGRELVEWQKTPQTTDSDGFEIRRRGNKSLKIKIILVMDQQPEKFRPSPQLERLVNTTTITKPAAVLAIWQYIKVNKLQESDEKKIVNNDSVLQSLFGCEKMSFSEIPAKLDSHLLTIEHLELEYYLDVERSEGSSVWDLTVDLDDPSKPKTISANLVAHQREIAIMEQRISELSNSLKASIRHEQILKKFAKNPVECIGQLLEAQCADQEAAIGEPTITIGDLSKTTNFESDEMEKAVSIYSASYNSTRHHPRH